MSIRLLNYLNRNGRIGQCVRSAAAALPARGIPCAASSRPRSFAYADGRATLRYGSANVDRRNFHNSKRLQGDDTHVIPFNLPDIGEGIFEVEVLQWFVEEGDTVTRFQPLCEVQSDKANTEISSKFDGKITKVYTAVGDMAAVGKPLIEIEVNSATADSEAQQSGKISRGDSVAASKPTQTDAASTPVEEAVEATATTSTAAATSANAAMSSTIVNEYVLATPAVRHIARQNDIDLKYVKGSGKDGRILKEDMLRLLDGGGAATPPPTAGTDAPTISVTALAEDRVEPIRGLMRTMVKTMTAAALVPQFLYCDEVRMDALMALRQEAKALAAQRNVKLTFLPFMVKAASLALTRYPRLNASLQLEKDAVVYRAAHNIGVAMDTPQGLLVPNVKNVQTKSVLEIAADIQELIEAGRANKLSVEQLSGGTFTLSNIGVVGGTYTSPVLLLPEVAIGAVGKIQRVPRFVGDTDEVEAAHIMNVSWSADHRVIDGVTIASFSNLWKDYLENPSLMLLDLK